MNQENLSLLCDYYELTMGNGYLLSGMADKIAYFDLFYREVPDKGGFAIAAGLEQLIDYIQNLHFDEDDLAFLRNKGIFDESFLEYLKNFKFNGDIFAVPEGTPVFPNEPMVTVRAKAIEAQLVETFLLLTLNHQSLIATKANRIVRAAQGRPVLEFGSRRAAGGDAAVLGARAAFIGGCAGTACTLTDRKFNVPAVGTMSHSWVQMFDSEYEAFATYCKLYPNNSTLLVDTYNVLQSGVPNAIRTFNEILKPLGITSCAIRLDSGDLAYLSKKARILLDEAGWTDCRIVASNALDEHLIFNLLHQGAKIDSFGVGERLITSKSEPVFGGVYKLCAVEDEHGVIQPKIKISENTAKINNKNGMAMADLICLHDEIIDSSQPLEIFDPEAIWKRKILADFTMVELQKPIFLNGELVYELPSIGEIRAYCQDQLATLWDEIKRMENPQGYYVDLSQKLWDLKQELLLKNR